MAVVIGIAPACDPSPEARLVGGSDLVYTDDAYMSAIRRAGAVPFVLPVCADAREARLAVASVDGLLLPGGTTPIAEGAPLLAALRELNPRRYRSDTLLARLATAGGVPLFGVCRGMQVWNEALGGTTWRSLSAHPSRPVDHHPGSPSAPAHRVNVREDGPLARILGTSAMTVNSHHRQGIRALAPGLRAEAWAEDGLVEAITLADPDASRSRFAWAVQFHPERLPESHPSWRLWMRFIEAAGRRRRTGRRFRLGGLGVPVNGAAGGAGSVGGGDSGERMDRAAGADWRGVRTGTRAEAWGG